MQSSEKVAGWWDGLQVGPPCCKHLWHCRSCWEPQQAAWGPLCTLFGEWVVHPVWLWAPRPQASASSIVPLGVNHSDTEIAPVGLKNSR